MRSKVSSATVRSSCQLQPVLERKALKSYVTSYCGWGRRPSEFSSIGRIYQMPNVHAQPTFGKHSPTSSSRSLTSDWPGSSYVSWSNVDEPIDRYVHCLMVQAQRCNFDGTNLEDNLIDQVIKGTVHIGHGAHHSQRSKPPVAHSRHGSIYAK